MLSYEMMSTDTRKSSSKDLVNTLYLSLMTSTYPRTVVISVDTPITQQHTKPAAITTLISIFPEEVTWD